MTLTRDFFWKRSSEGIDSVVYDHLCEMSTDDGSVRVGVYYRCKGSDVVGVGELVGGKDFLVDNPLGFAFVSDRDKPCPYLII
jgi:hypothetical protein